MTSETDTDKLSDAGDLDGRSTEAKRLQAHNAARQSWPCTLESLAANVSHATDEGRELMAWCFQRCLDEDEPITLAEFAKRVDYDVTTLSRIIRGTYNHPTDGTRMPFPPKLVDAMRLFRDLSLERALAMRADFIITPTAKKIFAGCELARESSSPVFLTGPSHIGKTCALIYHKEQRNHGRTIYVRLNAASGLGGMIRAIASSIKGIGMKANTATLIASIKRALKPNMLLILDEVHELMYTYRKESFFACLEVIREIYDATHCGMVLCGTQLLFKNIEENRGELEQLLRRGVHRVVLPSMPTIPDLTVILAHHGLEFPDKALKVTCTINKKPLVDQPYEILRQVGKDEGLKAICERVRYGQKLSAKAKEKFRWEFFVKAHLLIRANSEATPDWN